MRDYQAAKVYSWENQCIMKQYNSPQKTLSDLKRLSTFIFRYLHIKPAFLIVNKNIKISKAQCDTKKRIIEFNSKWQRKLILLHEICHLLPNCSEHNSTFVKNLCILLNRYMKIPKKVLRKSLDTYKIDYGKF